MESPSYLASGTIYPSTFIKQDFHSTAPFSALTAGVGDIPVGVADHRVKYLPGMSGVTAPIPAAQAGDPIRVYGEGEATLITTGAAVSAGQYLKPDASGNGIPVDTSGGTTAPQWYGARAEEFATGSGKLIRATVLLGEYTYHS